MSGVHFGTHLLLQGLRLAAASGVCGCGSGHSKPIHATVRSDSSEEPLLHKQGPDAKKEM